jgi:hypothetical protein
MTMAICKSRKSTHQIMSNGGFGLLTITRNGTTIAVPEEWLFEDGRIKKYAQAKIESMFKKAEAFNSLSGSEISEAL